MLRTMSSPEPVIKQEPSDDEYEPSFTVPTFPTSLFVPEDDEPTFVEPETVLQRATDKDGRPFPTLCFQTPHLEHPHHHRLICGHDIMTQKIQKCGQNCAMWADKKAVGVGFECPHPHCKKAASHFFRDRSAIRPRKCTLSHVYGRDITADQERLEEKRKIQEAQADRIKTRSGQVLLPSAPPRGAKRSPSPPAVSNSEARERAGKTTSNLDVGASLNQEFQNDLARDSVMQMTGGRPRANGVFQTDKEIVDARKMTVLTHGMLSSQIATPEEQNARKKKTLKRPAKSKAASNEPDLREADTDPELKFQFACDHCTKSITGHRYHCFDCVDDFDLCEECHVNNSHGHISTHRFKALAQPNNDSQGLTMLQQTFCICASTSTSFLVICNDCDTVFHPGCIGAGAEEKWEYSIEHMARGTHMRYDHLDWKGGKVFRCESCQKAYDVANAQSAREIRIIERAKKNEDAELQQEDEMEDAGVDAQKVVSSSQLNLKKRMAYELEDEFESGVVESQPSNEAKRFKFDLAFRPKN